MMNFRITAAALVTSLAWPAWAADGPNLRITATNIQDDKGSFVVWVYENADTWLSDGWRTRKIIPVAGNRKDNSISVELMLPAGEYALSIFQDVNDDGKLERNFIGLPKEPAGLSNNLRPKFGPPRFKDAKFTVGDTLVEQRIKLN